MTDFWDDNTDNILKDFPPCLRKNIEELCLNSKTDISGLSSITLSDISPHPHRLTYDNGTLNNFHFILKVPFAGKRLKWEIIFDPEDFDFPPDFDFNDEQFLAYPDLDIITENIESLVHWDLRNPKALSLVLNQFLALYKKQQLDKLRLENIYSRYWEEYQRLISDINDIDQQHVEVSIEGNNVVFLVALPVDCTSLPEYIQPVDSHPSSWYNPGEDFAHLKITILKLDGSRSNISLQLSPRLEQILAHYKNFHLPEFNEDTPLVDYVASVATLLENRIALVAEHYKMKKVYVLSIAAACSRNIVEYDTETFSKAVFLYHVDDYVCLVTVTFGVKFPLEKPSVMLSSAYCQEGRLCNRNLDKYPYNSTLRPEVNIEHLLEFLHDAVSRFMDHKH